MEFITEMKSNQKIFLPGLNGIRAIAALAVVFSHTNNRLPKFGLSSMPNWDLSGYAVTMFFTLSGFLITFLLFKELDKTSTINIRKFYMRRILRIWPLYYFYLLIILFLAGYSDLGKTFLMYLVILPNVANSYATYNDLPWIAPSGAAMSLIGHYWSLGVEEQFYSFWPWLIKKIKNLLIFLVLVPLAFLGLKVFAKFMHFSEPMQFLLHYSRFGCLALGALGAYMYWKKSFLVNILTNLYTQIGMWFFFILVVINKFHIYSIIDHEIVSVFVVILILGQISPKTKIISLENKVFDYLGKISFGIYVYNPLAIFVIYSFGKKYFVFSENLFSYLLIFFITALFNITLAHISYFTLERYFLTWKKHFVTVKSAASKQESYEK